MAGLRSLALKTLAKYHAIASPRGSSDRKKLAGQIRGMRKVGTLVGNSRHGTTAYLKAATSQAERRQALAKKKPAGIVKKHTIGAKKASTSAPVNPLKKTMGGVAARAQQKSKNKAFAAQHLKRAGRS